MILKKRYLALVGMITLILLGMSTIPVTATHEQEHRANYVYSFGMFYLECTTIEGIEDEDYIGGLHDVTLSTECTEFYLLTFPIWGTTLIEEPATLSIHMEHFFGNIDSCPYGVEIAGFCKNISWEQL